MTSKILDFAVDKLAWVYTIIIVAAYIGAAMSSYGYVFDSEMPRVAGIFILAPLTFLVLLALTIIVSIDRFYEPLIDVSVRQLLIPFLLVSGANHNIMMEFLDFYAAAVILVMMRIYMWIESFLDRMRASEDTRQKQPSNGLKNGKDDEPAEKIRFKVRKADGNFATILGMSDVKTRLQEAGQEIIKTSKEKKKPRNGILLSGKPGNGKTVFADALAGELKLPILSVSYGDLASKWVNETTENVAKVFRDATLQAPCVLFIDEIDSLIRDRSDAGSSSEGPQITNTILTEIVNIRKVGVVVVAATNFLDKLDPAAIREGRFDFKIEITPPDMAARSGLIEKFAVSNGVTVNTETRDLATKRWDGFSVARIAAIMEEAARMVSKEKRKIAQFTDLQTALRQVQGRKGTIPENTPMLDELAMIPPMRDKLKGVARRMKHIEEIEKMGGTVPSGLLFYGPPGTGKTVTARALAKESGWGFLSASGADLMSTPTKIDEILADASDIRPCIVFLDEADDILGDRRYNGNVSAITNKLLAAMDGSGGKVPDVVFVAATNHPESMDSAAMRGGRFTEKIEFAPPTFDVVADYVNRWMGSIKAQTSSTLTATAIARRVEGESIANIKEVLQTAINVAIGRCELGKDEPVIGMADIDDACTMVLEIDR